MHLIFVFGFVLFINGISAEMPLKKCCNNTSYLVNWNCEIDTRRRIQILSDENDILSKIKDNQINEDHCIDIANNTIMEFETKDKSIIQKSKIDVEYFRKCCPLNYTYNFETHSCKSNPQLNYSFISQKLIYVGLPHCRVIFDYKLDSSNNYRIKDKILYIDFNSSLLHFSDRKFCIDIDENKNFVARGCSLSKFDMTICNTKQCIHKCCPDGKSFINGNCIDTYKYGMNLTFTNRINRTEDSFAIIHNRNYNLIFLSNSIQYSVDKKGVFKVFYNRTNSFRRYNVTEESYCIEHIQRDNSSSFQFFRFSHDEDIEMKFLITRWAKVISCICILFTIILIYLMNPKSRNTNQKTMISYCIAMLFHFGLLIYAQFITEREDTSCLVTSLLTFYTAHCTFTWLNVMSFDIWKHCASKDSVHGPREDRNKRKEFLLYSLYGWSVPLLPLLIVFTFYKQESIPYSIRPFLAEYKCFVDDRPGNYAKLIYYSVPILIIEIWNVVFFTKTIQCYLRIKGDIAKQNDNKRSNYERKKDQLVLIIKLGIYMGISLIFEVISFSSDMNRESIFKYMEVIWDTINCLQGLFILIVFIYTPKVLEVFRQLVCNAKNKDEKRSMNTGQSSLSLYAIKGTVSNETL